MSANVSGRFITTNDYQAYHQAMQDPKEFAKYSDMAKLVTLAKRSGTRAQTNKQRDPCLPELRRRRQNALRIGRLWDAKAERTALQQEQRARHWQEHQAGQQAAQQIAAARRAELARVRSSLEEYAAQPDAMKSVFSARTSRAMFRIPLAGQVNAYCWAPDLRNAVWPNLAETVTQNALKFEVEWERDHVTLTGHGMDKIKPPTAKERRQRLCLEAGRCLCSLEMRGFRMVHLSLTRALLEFMGPGSRKTGISANRKALEDAAIVMRFSSSRPAASQVNHTSTAATVSAETRWWHVALLYLEPLRPTFLRMLEHSQQSQQSRTLMVAHKLGQNSAWWQTVWEVVEALSPHMEWSIDFWHISGTSPKDLAQAPTLVHVSLITQQQMLWRGPSDLAVAQAEGSSDETEDEVQVPPAPPLPPAPPAASPPHPSPPASRPSPPVPHCSVACDPASSRPQADESQAVRNDAERCKAGEVTTIKGPDGMLLQMLCTYRKPSLAAPFGGYQARCYHHEPEQRKNKNGTAYVLPCRKEMRCKTATDSANIIRQLRRWIRSGPKHATRVDHQAVRPDARTHSSGDPSDSDSDSSDSTIKGGSLPCSPDAKQPAAQRPAGAPPGGVARPCALAGFTSDSLWQHQMGGVKAEHGCVLRRGVATRDVPADGNCLFHAFGAEVHNAYKDSLLPPGISADQAQAPGQAWREYFLDYIRTTTDVVDGLSIRDWIEASEGKSLEDYCQLMAVARGPETWGGFLDVAVLCHAWGRGLRCIMLQSLEGGGYQALACAGSRSSDPAVRCIYIAWNGSHWVRARVKQDVAATLSAWIHDDDPDASTSTIVWGPCIVID
jgi:hypothetical protein